MSNEILVVLACLCCFSSALSLGLMILCGGAKLNKSDNEIREGRIL